MADSSPGQGPSRGPSRPRAQVRINWLTLRLSITNKPSPKQHALDPMMSNKETSSVQPGA